MDFMISPNAVMSQLCVALCDYLVLVFLKFQLKLSHSIQQILQLLQFNLFEQNDFIELLKSPELKLTSCKKQLSFTCDYEAAVKNIS